MGTGTNIFDASFQQLERFRVTGAGSRALVNKLNGPVDWINKNHGVMPVPQQVMPERKGGAVAGGGGRVTEMKFINMGEITHDFIMCRPFSGGPDDDVRVALPWILRSSPFGLGQPPRNGFRYQYTAASLRFSIPISGGDRIQQQITTSYVRFDRIMVIDFPDALHETESSASRGVNLLDINVDARAWAERP